MRPDAPKTVTHEEAVTAKLAVIKALAPYASAVLLDAVYGLGPAIATGALPGNVGLLVAVEDGDYATVGQQGQLLAHWSVAKIKRLGASAVKLFFHYNPDDADAQDDFVRAVVADCQRYDLPLFAEPIVYSHRTADKRRLVIESARRIGQCGVDVLKLEFPVDVQQEKEESVWASACRELSAATPTPWVLLSAGVDFETFARQLSIACQAGASGYVAGRAIWQEAVTLGGEARSQFLQQVAIPCMQRLTHIAQTHARTWTDYYPQETAWSEEWHIHYDA